MVTESEIAGTPCFSILLRSGTSSHSTSRYRVDVDRLTGHLLRSGNEEQWISWTDIHTTTVARDYFTWKGPTRTVQEARWLRKKF